MKDQKEFRRINKFLFVLVVLLLEVIFFVRLEMTKIDKENKITFEESKIELSPQNIKGIIDFAESVVQSNDLLVYYAFVHTGNSPPRINLGLKNIRGSRIDDVHVKVNHAWGVYEYSTGPIVNNLDDEEYHMIGGFVYNIELTPIVNGQNLETITIENIDRCGGADLNSDGIVNQTDTNLYLRQPSQNGCSFPNWCNGLDLYHDGTIGVNDIDLQILEDYQGYNCSIGDRGLIDIYGPVSFTFSDNVVILVNTTSTSVGTSFSPRYKEFMIEYGYTQNNLSFNFSASTLGYGIELLDLKLNKTIFLNASVIDTLGNKISKNISFNSNLRRYVRDLNSYDDVLLVVNENSPISNQIGDYFYLNRKNKGLKYVVYINAPDKELITFEEFNTSVRKPIENYISTNNLTNKIYYIVTTKGVPLKYYGYDPGSSYRSFSIDSSLALISQKLNFTIDYTKKGLRCWKHQFEDFLRYSKEINETECYQINNSNLAYESWMGCEFINTFSIYCPGVVPSVYYGLIHGNQLSPYFTKKAPMYIVTRLTGYTFEDIKKLIDNSQLASNHDGIYLFDDLGYVVSNVQVYNVPQNTFAINRNNLMAYISYGSNDCCFNGAQGQCGNSPTCNGMINNLPYWKNSLNWNLSFYPGAIGLMYVSSSGYTFTEGSNLSEIFGGQSLSAGLITQGITGIDAYVAEPIHGKVDQGVANKYLDGLTLGESYYSNLDLNFRTVIVGDPKTHIVDKSNYCEILFKRSENSFLRGCGDQDYDFKPDVNKDHIVDREDITIIEQNLNDQTWCRAQLQSIDICGEILCESGADTIIVDGVVNQNELNNYIQKYYLGDVNINNISNAIVEHLNGCG